MLAANILFMFTNKNFKILLSIVIMSNGYQMIALLIGMGVLQDVFAEQVGGIHGVSRCTQGALLVCLVVVVLYAEKGARYIAKVDLEGS